MLFVVVVIINICVRVREDVSELVNVWSVRVYDKWDNTIIFAC